MTIPTITEHPGGIICIDGVPILGIVTQNLRVSEAAELLDYILDAVYAFIEDREMPDEDDTVH